MAGLCPQQGLSPLEEAAWRCSETVLGVLTGRTHLPW